MKRVNNDRHVKLSKWLRDNEFPPPMLPMVCGYAPLAEDVLKIITQDWDAEHSPTAEEVAANESAVQKIQLARQNAIDDADSPDGRRTPVVPAPLPNPLPPADTVKGGTSKAARTGADVGVEEADSEEKVRNLRENRGGGF